MKFSASGLLFDNDGVLVDSHQAAIDAWSIWCSEYAPHINWDSSENAGVRAEDKVRLWVAPELFDEANNRINQLEQDTAHETVALGGAAELLHSLKAGTWTVCTSANPNIGRARLEAAGLPVPAELVTAADVAHGKPNPDPYLLGAQRLGFDPRKGAAHVRLVVVLPPRHVVQEQDGGCRVGIPVVGERLKSVGGGQGPARIPIRVLLIKVLAELVEPPLFRRSDSAAGIWVPLGKDQVVHGRVEIGRAHV